MMGRARRATRPTSCLFGAPLVLPADCDRWRECGHCAPAVLPPGSLGESRSGAVMRSGGDATRTDQSYPAGPVHDGKQRRRARPNQAWLNQPTVHKIPALARCRASETSYPIAIFLPQPRLPPPPEQGMAQRRRAEATNHGSTKPRNGRRYSMALLSHSRMSHNIRFTTYLAHSLA
jgi:hypothetical protein